MCILLGIITATAIPASAYEEDYEMSNSGSDGNDAMDSDDEGAGGFLSSNSLLIVEARYGWAADLRESVAGTIDVTEKLQSAVRRELPSDAARSQESVRDYEIPEQLVLNENAEQVNYFRNSLWPEAAGVKEPRRFLVRHIYMPDCLWFSYNTWEALRAEHGDFEELIVAAARAQTGASGSPSGLMMTEAASREAMQQVMGFVDESILGGIEYDNEGDPPLQTLLAASGQGPVEGVASGASSTICGRCLGDIGWEARNGGASTAVECSHPGHLDCVLAEPSKPCVLCPVAERLRKAGVDPSGPEGTARLARQLPAKHCLQDLSLELRNEHGSDAELGRLAVMHLEQVWRLLRLKVGRSSAALFREENRNDPGVRQLVTPSIPYDNERLAVLLLVLSFDWWGIGLQCIPGSRSVGPRDTASWLN